MFNAYVRLCDFIAVVAVKARNVHRIQSVCKIRIIFQHIRSFFTGKSYAINIITVEFISKIRKFKRYGKPGIFFRIAFYFFHYGIYIAASDITRNRRTTIVFIHQKGRKSCQTHTRRRVVADHHTEGSRKFFVAVILSQIYRLACFDVFYFSVLVVFNVAFVHYFTVIGLDTVRFLLRSNVFEPNKFRFPVHVYEFVAHVSFIRGRRKIFFLMPDIRQRINAVHIRENADVKRIYARFVVVPIISESHVFHARPRVSKCRQLHRCTFFIYRIGNVGIIFFRPFPSVIFVGYSIIRIAFFDEFDDRRFCDTVVIRKGKHYCTIGRKRKSLIYRDFF